MVWLRRLAGDTRAWPIFSPFETRLPLSLFGHRVGQRRLGPSGARAGLAHGDWPASTLDSVQKVSRRNSQAPSTAALPLLAGREQSICEICLPCLAAFDETHSAVLLAFRCPARHDPKNDNYLTVRKGKNKRPVFARSTLRKQARSLTLIRLHGSFELNVTMGMPPILHSSQHCPSGVHLSSLPTAFTSFLSNVIFLADCYSLRIDCTDLCTCMQLIWERAHCGLWHRIPTTSLKAPIDFSPRRNPDI